MGSGIWRWQWIATAASSGQGPVRPSLQDLTAGLRHNDKRKHARSPGEKNPALRVPRVLLLVVPDCPPPARQSPLSFAVAESSLAAHVDRLDAAQAPEEVRRTTALYHPPPPSLTWIAAADTIRILVATDNHVGYAERDPVRGNDSYVTFNEIMELARERDVTLPPLTLTPRYCNRRVVVLESNGAG